VITSHPTRAEGAAPHVSRLVASRREGYGLLRAFYHDEALYAHELDRIWRHGWVFAGHTCQIPRPGDYFTVTLDADSLIVVRDDQVRTRPTRRYVERLPPGAALAHARVQPRRLSALVPAAIVGRRRRTSRTRDAWGSSVIRQAPRLA